MSNVINLEAAAIERMSRARKWLSMRGCDIRFDGNGFHGDVSAMTDEEFSASWAVLDVVDDLLGDELSCGITAVALLDNDLVVAVDGEYMRAYGLSLPPTARDWCDAYGRCYEQISFSASEVTA